MVEGPSQHFYHKLDEGSNMSTEGYGSLRSGCPLRVMGACGCPLRVPNRLSSDALAQALVDPRFPTIALWMYDEWTIDLRRLTVGQAFAQGAFGKLYKGTYNGEDVAIKLLERPEHDPERAHSMEQQFQLEVMMLATLKHPNIVRFIGACRKPMVWCIVTELYPHKNYILFVL